MNGTEKEVRKIRSILVFVVVSLILLGLGGLVLYGANLAVSDIHRYHYGR